MPLDLNGPNLEAELLRQALNPPAQVAQVQEEPKKIGKWPWITLLAGQGADIGTTAYALNSGRFEEANPLLGDSLGRILLTKAGVTGGIGILMKLLERTGDPEKVKAAKLAGYVSGAAGAIPAAMNIRTLTK